MSHELPESSPVDKIRQAGTLLGSAARQIARDVADAGKETWPEIKDKAREVGENVQTRIAEARSEKEPRDPNVVDGEVVEEGRA
ncbi:Uncharacterised protein [Corynebacterium renale]|uniref:hypothetical protein n=1 Tax=Corynebacterium renale TaxID=1724 RepID=UPI000DA3D926|nr:hypothetical protein [Corynebacterium renale]SQG63903.1 Uncharacterised protein [Corynebacterium renale]STD02803.1 Uncharacterised protein [Corynebacterium renale]